MKCSWKEIHNQNFLHMYDAQVMATSPSSSWESPGTRHRLILALNLVELSIAIAQTFGAK